MASQITTNPKPVNDVSLLTSTATAKGEFIQRIVETVKWVIVGEKNVQNRLYVRFTQF